jgi:hypothetical protein
MLPGIGFRALLMDVNMLRMNVAATQEIHTLLGAASPAIIG